MVGLKNMKYFKLKFIIGLFVFILLFMSLDVDSVSAMALNNSTSTAVNEKQITNIFASGVDRIEKVIDNNQLNYYIVSASDAPASFKAQSNFLTCSLC